MRTFASITQFVEFLGTRVEAVRSGQFHGMHEAADMLVHTAQGMIGEYQGAVGDFPEWKELAQTTLYGGVDEHGRRFPGKVELGYAPPDNPLLRTGQMRGSIEKHVEEHTIVIGTHDPVAHYQEFGTDKIPARSFIGRAMFVECHRATHIIFGHIIAAMTGNPPPRA